MPLIEQLINVCGESNNKMSEKSALTGVMSYLNWFVASKSLYFKNQSRKARISFRCLNKCLSFNTRAPLQLDHNTKMRNFRVNMVELTPSPHTSHRPHIHHTFSSLFWCGADSLQWVICVYLSVSSFHQSFWDPDSCQHISRSWLGLSHLLKPPRLPAMLCKYLVFSSTSASTHWPPCS